MGKQQTSLDVANACLDSREHCPWPRTSWRIPSNHHCHAGKSSDTTPHQDGPDPGTEHAKWDRKVRSAVLVASFGCEHSHCSIVHTQHPASSQPQESGDEPSPTRPNATPLYLSLDPSPYPIQQHARSSTRYYQHSAHPKQGTQNWYYE